MTVMRVMLFVLDVSMLRKCEADGNSGVGDGRGGSSVKRSENWSHPIPSIDLRR